MSTESECHASVDKVELLLARVYYSHCPWGVDLQFCSRQPDTKAASVRQYFHCRGLEGYCLGLVLTITVPVLVLVLSPVSTTRVHGPSSRAELTARELGCIFWHPSWRPEFTARQLGCIFRHPSTRAVNSGSGNRALLSWSCASRARQFKTSDSDGQCVAWSAVHLPYWRSTHLCQFNNLCSH